MESAVSISRGQKVVKIYWILAFVQVAHSIEEVYAHLDLKFESMSAAMHQAIAWIPVFKLDSTLFAIINILMITLLLGAIPGMGRNAKWAISLAWLWAVVEIANGVFHTTTWLWLKAYFPGSLSGPILLIPAILLAKTLIESES